MLNTRKFKVLIPHCYSYKRINRLEKKGFKEINVEPTFRDCIMLSLYNNISFEETLKLMRSCLNINNLVAMSMVYYFYSEEFSNYLKNNKDNQRIIRRNIKKILLRWKDLMNQSDDILYPQNKYIKEILTTLEID